ncbi:hypothetical protein L596_016072 [Steinernema carpocapsae]|uniref:Ketosynthase family 3 (KS3) domain-containing protein n=1 Tax=Steinernema carpocapsae TaxID=34508 RepID=A0A4U5NHX3_STECR|nr:hypothetical protein L596_016072 [Steinernema carpocapsae]
MDLQKSVSIIGRACRLPGCDSFDEFRDAVLVGRDLTEEIPSNRWLLDGVKLMYPNFKAGFVESIDLFDNKYFNINTEEALAMDPSQRVLLELTVEALDSAGLSLSSVALARTAVFVAQSDSSEYAEMIDEPSRYHTAGTHAALTAGR